MTKDRILKAIRSLTRELGRVPGERAFQSATGASRSDLWNAGFANYGEAAKAAGLTPNRLKSAYSTSEMLEKLALLTRQLGKFPTKGDIKVSRSKDNTFPSYEAFDSEKNPTFGCGQCCWSFAAIMTNISISCQSLKQLLRKVV